jgi:4-amino-4-deoxy-L-arabinose transferase-like glycosyltransferase
MTFPRIDFGRFFTGAFIVWCILILLGMWVDVMEVDAAQYAGIGREMKENGSWLEVYERGEDYNSLGNPDKPPLLFWTSAASFILFGENTFTYKLISVLVGLLGLWSVYQLGRLIYDSRTGKIAAMLYGTSLGFILMMNDVRTDTLLIGWVAFAAWQLERYFRLKLWSAWFFAFSGIALAMLAKGPLGLIAVAAAFGADAILRRDWKRIFRWEWLPGLLVIGIWLLPMLIGLYRQWGWEHGVKYYFWTQSFGRITGENVWKNDSSPFFFVHTTLWAFLPWSGILVAALIKQLAEIRRSLTNALPGEFIGTAGFVLLFVAMSLSHFKLPHYIYITFPFAALLAADFLADMPGTGKMFKWLNTFQFVLSLIILTVVAVVIFWIFPSSEIWWAVFVLCLVVTIRFYLQKSDLLLEITGPSVIAILLFGLVANAWFYPQLLTFQSSSNAGKWIATQELKKGEVGLFQIGEESIHALDFYAGMTVPAYDSTTQLLSTDSLQWLYTHISGIEALKSAGFTTEIVAEWPFFRVTHLNGRFLNPDTRAQTLEKRYIVRISR